MSGEPTSFKKIAARENDMRDIRGGSEDTARNMGILPRKDARRYLANDLVAAIARHQ
jgi:hypothetical protein